MFTIKDICNIAVQIEHNGEAAYRQAATRVASKPIEALLSKMADEELRHSQWFDALSIKQGIASDHQEMEAMGRTLLQEMVKDQTFSLTSASLSQAEQIEALIKQAVEFEKDTITFYEMLLEFIDDELVQKQLGIIIEEERQHIVQLRQLNDATVA